MYIRLQRDRQPAFLVRNFYQVEVVLLFSLSKSEFRSLYMVVTFFSADATKSG